MTRPEAWASRIEADLDQGGLTFQRGVLADQAQLDRMQGIGHVEVEIEGEDAATLDLEEGAGHGPPLSASRMKGSCRCRG